MMKRKRWGRIGAAMAALALGACGDKQEAAPPERYVPPPALARNLNSTEIDSLVRMKLEYHISRDEYWDGHGGVLANPSFEVWYPNGRMHILQAAAVLKQMELARRNTEKWFGRTPASVLVVVCSPTLETFRASTGRDWWHYSSLKGDTLTLQSPMDLFMRGLLTIAVPREYYEWAVGSLSDQRAPHWLAEGLASQLSNEAPILEEQTGEFGERSRVMSMGDMERELKREKDRIETRRATYNAYRMVEKLLQTHGRPAVLAFVIACGEEKDVDAASKRALGADFDAIVSEARSWTTAETN